MEKAQYARIYAESPPPLPLLLTLPSHHPTFRRPAGAMIDLALKSELRLTASGSSGLHNCLIKQWAVRVSSTRARPCHRGRAISTFAERPFSAAVTAKKPINATAAPGRIVSRLSATGTTRSVQSTHLTQQARTSKSTP